MFGWYDYLLFASILAISLSIGLGLGLAGGTQKTSREYLLANRNLSEYGHVIGPYIFNTRIAAIDQ